MRRDVLLNVTVCHKMWGRDAKCDPISCMQVYIKYRTIICQKLANSSFLKEKLDFLETFAIMKPPGTQGVAKCNFLKSLRILQQGCREVAACCKHEQSLSIKNACLSGSMYL